MNEATPTIPAVENMDGADSRPPSDRVRLFTFAVWLVGAAAAWFLLKELAPLLRPLFLAIFLAYVIVPIRLKLQRRTHGLTSLAVVSVLVLLGLSGAAFLIYGNVVAFNRDLPQLLQRMRDIFEQVRLFVSERIPGGADIISGTSQVEEQVAERLKEAAGSLANLTAGLVLEALEIAFYLIFLLVEAGRFSERIRNGFAGERAEQILAVTGRINEAMASYLHVKVKASLVLAVPIAIMLWAFGVRFAFLWGVLFFFSNFIPYFGSIVMCVLAALFAFLQLDFGWQPVVVALALFGLRTLASDLLEPAMTGKAVNLSPVVILMALSFWSLCWGFTGMLLAVPLTVMVKIILENIEPTKPLANLMSESS